jgi:hypothetical protein
MAAQTLPSLRLLYIPVRARVENIRMMLHFRQVPFEDKILTFKELYDLQKVLPYEQLPVLEVGPSSNPVCASDPSCRAEISFIRMILSVSEG